MLTLSASSTLMLTLSGSYVSIAQTLKSPLLLTGEVRPCSSDPHFEKGWNMTR